MAELCECRAVRLALEKRIEHFIEHAIAYGGLVRLEDVFKGLLPYIAAGLLMLLLLCLFPELAAIEDPETRASAFADELAHLSNRLGLQSTLREVGITAEDLPKMAKDAMKQTRLLVNNPRPVTEADALAIYQAAL